MFSPPYFVLWSQLELKGGLNQAAKLIGSISSFFAVCIVDPEHSWFDRNVIGDFEVVITFDREARLTA